MAGRFSIGEEHTASSNLAPAWRPVASASFSYCWPRPGSSPLTFAEALWTSAVRGAERVAVSQNRNLSRALMLGMTV